jgi:hypothetical protein
MCMVLIPLPYRAAAGLPTGRVLRCTRTGYWTTSIIAPSSPGRLSRMREECCCQPSCHIQVQLPTRAIMVPILFCPCRTHHAHASHKGYDRGCCALTMKNTSGEQRDTHCDSLLLDH